MQHLDVVVVGAGPTGLACGIELKQRGVNTLLIEKGVIGGQIALTEMVENYPGIPQVNGFDLAQASARVSTA